MNLFGASKTVIVFDEDNYLVYLGAFLYKTKGNEYKKEKEYLKELVKQYWKQYHKKPSTLKDSKKIEIIQEVFGIDELDII
ncbi:MAG: hypothetical protein J6V44_03460 [Methanobrevibacter sp.]|nr:hypothetical protein [Methanobrevibacter sp.]